MILDTPSNIKGLINAPSIYTPAVYKVSLKQQDFENGYINRYFVGRINYEDFFETNFADYNLTVKNFYKKIIIKWKITGPEYSQYTGNMLETVGVVNYNVAQIQNAKSTFNNIDSVLTDPKQYWRGY
jgi:hypothetical protein